MLGVKVIHTVNGDSNDLGQLDTLWANEGWHLGQWEVLLVGSRRGWVDDLDIQLEVLDQSGGDDTPDFRVGKKSSLRHCICSG